MNANQFGMSEPILGSDLRGVPYFPNPTHDEALARLEFLVEDRRRLGLLLGGPGLGKSLVLSVLADRLARAGRPVVRLRLTGVDFAEFPWLIAAGLGLSPRDGDSPVKLWRIIVDRVAENRYQQLGTTFLLDDADQASPELSASIQRLAQCDETPEAWLTVVLAADQKQVARISPRLLDLAEMRIDLEPWDATTTAGYLNAAFVSPGYTSKVFTRGAIERVCQLSHGVPRRVAQLADLALLAGEDNGSETIEADIVGLAYDELSAARVAPSDR